jgi:ABC-type lipoprotein release transport system permease subunit
VLRLPVSYSLRNLARRPWRTALTVLGTAVVVFAAVLMLALWRGLVERLQATGEATNVLAISRAGQNNMFSSIPEDEVTYLWGLPGVATDESGAALVSAELMHMPFVNVEGATGKGIPVSVRGVNAVAYDVHRSVRLVEGRLPEDSFEIVAGAAIHSKLGVTADVVGVGRAISFENREWRIVGRFEAGGSLFESEFWSREEDLQTVLRRRTHSFVVVRMEDPSKVPAAMKEFEKSGAVERFFKGWPEVAYYREFMAALAWVKWLSVFMVVAVTIAGALIGVNTMYSAVVSRLHEIAAQRVLGFSAADIAGAFLVESVAISLLGGAAGVAAGLLVNDLPLNLSQGAFFLVVDWPVMAAGMGLAVVIGTLGALLPAAKGLRMGIVDAMRHG